jgi:hypothetical protein
MRQPILRQSAQKNLPPRAGAACRRAATTACVGSGWLGRRDFASGWWDRENVLPDPGIRPHAGECRATSSGRPMRRRLRAKSSTARRRHRPRSTPGTHAGKCCRAYDRAEGSAAPPAEDPWLPLNTERLPGQCRGSCLGNTPRRPPDPCSRPSHRCSHRSCRSSRRWHRHSRQ